MFPSLMTTDSTLQGSGDEYKAVTPSVQRAANVAGNGETRQIGKEAVRGDAARCDVLVLKPLFPWPHNVVWTLYLAMRFGTVLFF